MINNNSDDVYCPSWQDKMFGADKTIEDVMVTVNLCHTLSLVWVKWKFP